MLNEIRVVFPTLRPRIQETRDITGYSEPERTRLELNRPGWGGARVAGTEDVKGLII
jgi:hypothetical protein